MKFNRNISPTLSNPRNNSSLLSVTDNLIRPNIPRYTWNKLCAVHGVLVAITESNRTAKPPPFSFIVNSVAEPLAFFLVPSVGLL